MTVVIVVFVTAAVTVTVAVYVAVSLLVDNVAGDALSCCFIPLLVVCVHGNYGN